MYACICVCKIVYVCKILTMVIKYVYLVCIRKFFNNYVRHLSVIVLIKFFHWSKLFAGITWASSIEIVSIKSWFMLFSIFGKIKLSILRVTTFKILIFVSSLSVFDDCSACTTYYILFDKQLNDFSVHLKYNLYL